ncbi:Uncharacterised protein [Mycobacteroides abscessus subsp. abscessus]|nr:Uncharacterised protein [Mycobacteroides abscessus subsp. abscessus]
MPEPLRPTSATISPQPTRSETSSSTRLRPYHLVTEVSSAAAVVECWDNSVTSKTAVMIDLS